MKPPINFSQTKDERARRRSQAKGHSYNIVIEESERRRAKEREDEQFARSLGVHLTYDETRSPGMKLWR